MRVGVGRFSVRSLLMGMIALVGVAVGGMAITDLEASARRYAVVKRVERYNELANECLIAGNAFAFERGRSVISLHKNAVLPDIDRVFIDAQRQQADQAVIRALALLAQYPDPAMSEHGRALRAAWEKLQGLRVPLERDFGVPRSARDANLPRQWWIAGNALIEELEHVVADVSWVTGAAVEFDRMSSARLLLLQLRDNVGREAERVGSLLAGHDRLSSTTAAELLEWRGRSNQLWKQLERDARFIADPGFIRALTDLREGFFEGLRPLNESLLEPASSSSGPVLTIEEYSEIAVPLLASVVPAFVSIEQLTRKLAGQQKLAARADFRRDLLILCLVFGMLAGVSLVVRQRLLLPMRESLLRIQRLCGNSGRRGDGESRDEFVAVRRALDLLEETLRLRAEDTRLLEESNRRLEHLSVTDGLTGLFNRRHFNLALSQEWARACRTGRNLSLILVDIDYFKRYNDSYGHQSGDACLIKVAGVLKAHARRSGDCAARYGGEEFALILPELSSVQASEVAARIHQSLTELALPHSGSDYGIVTLSIGVATQVPGDKPCPEDLVRLADEALYAAKNGGRNRVVCAPEQESGAPA